jgi:hypothetical protein
VFVNYYNQNINYYFLALTFARVFTNVETSDAYKHIFHEVFSTVEKDTGKEIGFSYLNSNFDGIGCIIADAHKGQAIGNYILCKIFVNSFFLLISFF